MSDYIENSMTEALFRFGMYIKEADNAKVKIRSKEYIKALNKTIKCLKELGEPVPSIIKEFKSICNLMLESDDYIEQFRQLKIN
jgi:hypothetical protein